jgi:hypothetical protein
MFVAGALLVSTAAILALRLRTSAAVAPPAV